MNSNKTPRQIIEELYLMALSRRPTQSELTLLESAFQNGTVEQDAAEDILWTLLNSREFLFNH